MSGCSCPPPRKLRVTGEVWEDSSGVNVIGDGDKTARIRCGRCGGKVGFIGSELLTDLFGISESEIVNGRCLTEGERPTLEVDLE